MRYFVKRGVVYSKKGVPECPRWFADERLVFEFTEEGITQVDYFNPAQWEGNHTIFLRRLKDGLRYYIEQGLFTYKPEYLDVRLWPFGVQAGMKVEGHEFRHSVLAVDESIIIMLETPKTLNCDFRFKLEINENFALIPCDPNDERYCDMGAHRQWGKWSFDPELNALMTGFIETLKDGVAAPPGVGLYQTGMNIFMGADFKLEHIQRMHGGKHILRSMALEAGKKYSFVICMIPKNPGATPVEEYWRSKVSRIEEKVFNQTCRYRRVSQNIPRLISPYKELNNTISLYPMYYEALKICKVPGAIRANTFFYWVWGWDGMAANYSVLYWGDAEQVKANLDFYRRYSDPEKGIAHSYKQDMSISAVSSLPAQGMFICLLHRYYAMTGDREEVVKHYDFCKSIFNQILQKEVRQTGFCEGISLFPDFRDAMKETGQDLSTFNNTVFYCAARSMEQLAALLGDSQQKTKARGIFLRMEENFAKLFFDAQKQYPVSSIDSQTLQKRDSFMTGSVRWENNFLSELVQDISSECLQFFDKNAVSEFGIRDVPLWSSSFDLDSNQLHCWWPVTGEYFVRLANENNRKDLLERWIQWVSYWTKHLTCPEAVSYYAENGEPEFDRWNSKKGSWQAFSMKALYEAAVHGVVGVGAEAGGLTFYPYDGEPLKFIGLHFMGRKFDIEMMGGGRYIEYIDVDGELIRGTNKLPFDAGRRSRVKVKVKRTKIKPYNFYILSGYGIYMSRYCYNEGTITARFTGGGTCRLRLASDKRLVVLADGNALDCVFDKLNERVMVEFDLEPGKELDIQIFQSD